MSTVYPRGNAGPWLADDDQVTCDGFLLGDGSYHVSDAVQGPTVDGIEFRGRHFAHSHTNLVRGTERGTVRGSG